MNQIKGDAKKNVTTTVKMNTAAFCILYGLAKLIKGFLILQKAIQTISIGFANSTLHFDECFRQN